MKIYDFPAAPNPKRVRAFVAEKGIEVPFQTVDVFAGEQRSAEFLVRNPRGELPVLELDDGTCIAESVAICRYLESCHPEPNLLGEDAKETAIIEMWNRRMELGLFRYVADYYQHRLEFFRERVHQVPQYVPVAQQSATEWLAWLDGQLGPGSFIAGARFSIADITALVAVDLGTPDVFTVDQTYPNVSRWLATVSERASAAVVRGLLEDT